MNGTPGAGGTSAVPPFLPALIGTVRNVGYRFVLPPREQAKDFADTPPGTPSGSPVR